MAKRSSVGKAHELSVESLLKSKSILEKLRAVEILKGKRDKDRLFELLYSESWHVRERAAQVLSEWGSEIEDKTLPLLEEKFWYVRAVAAFILGNVGTEKSIEPLKRHLLERNEPVRIESARALVRIKLRKPEIADLISQEDLKLIEENLKIARDTELLENLKSGE